MLFYAAASLSQPIWDALHRVAEETLGERVVMITGLGMTETSPFAICANWQAGRSAASATRRPARAAARCRGDKLEARYRGRTSRPASGGRKRSRGRASTRMAFYRSGDAVRFLDPADPSRGWCSTAASPRTSRSTAAPG